MKVAATLPSAMRALAARFAPALAAVAALCASSAALANAQRWQLNMPRGVTETSAEVYQLHMIVLWICIIIGVLVFGAMAVAMFRFRKSKGAVAATWSHNTKAEIVWTTVPVLLLVAMAWPATKTLMFMADTTESEMTVKVTGYQWMWRYEILNYRGQSTPVNFLSRIERTSDQVRQRGSGMDPYAVEVDGVNTYLLDVDNPLVLPTDTKIRFVITADDVIHSWWVPVLGWKQDAIPGVINEAWTDIKFPGTYRGQCAELCGKDHAFMPIVVEAVTPAEFDAWLAARSADTDTGIEAAARTAQAQPVAAPVKG